MHLAHIAQDARILRLMCRKRGRPPKVKERLRAQSLFAVASNTEIARMLKVDHSTVWRWRMEHRRTEARCQTDTAGTL